MAKNATRLSIQPNTKKKSNFFVTFFFITLTVVDNKFLFFFQNDFKNRILWTLSDTNNVISQPLVLTEKKCKQTLQKKNVNTSQEKCHISEKHILANYLETADTIKKLRLISDSAHQKT